VDQFHKVFTIATGVGLVGLILYNSKAATAIMKQAGGTLGELVGAVRGDRGVTA